MKSPKRFGTILCIAAFTAAALLAGSTHSEKAMWIKISEQGKLKTTIAITEPIARLIAESDKENVHFSSHKDRDLITRQMMKDVLDGKKSSMKEEDAEDGTEAEIFMKKLDVPGSRGDKSRLILETYKDGKRTFRMKLGEFEIESTDEESEKPSKNDFSWKALLPFLSKTGGGVYILDHNDNTEVWLFVE
jgi:hypothetical protein